MGKRKIANVGCQIKKVITKAREVEGYSNLQNTDKTRIGLLVEEDRPKEENK